MISQILCQVLTGVLLADSHPLQTSANTAPHVAVVRSCRVAGRGSMLFHLLGVCPAARHRRLPRTRAGVVAAELGAAPSLAVWLSLFTASDAGCVLHDKFFTDCSFATGAWSSPGYLPPCSGGRGNKYEAEVYAVILEGNDYKEIAEGEITLGRY